MATPTPDNRLLNELITKVCTIVVDKIFQFLSFLRSQILNNKSISSIMLLKAETDYVCLLSIYLPRKKLNESLKRIKTNYGKI